MWTKTLDLNRIRDARVYLELWKDLIEVTLGGSPAHLHDVPDDTALDLASRIFRELDPRPTPPLIQ